MMCRKVLTTCTGTVRTRKQKHTYILSSPHQKLGYSFKSHKETCVASALWAVHELSSVLELYGVRSSFDAWSHLHS
jgi:hypothetical protein